MTDLSGSPRASPESTAPRYCIERMLNHPETTARAAETRTQLLRGTLAAIREVGFAGLSARVVAAHAGVNQALIFYHYGSMDGLVAETCRQATLERVAVWAPELELVGDLSELVELARRLHRVEAAEGNVTVLAQALAASQADEGLASVIGESLALWLGPIEATAARILEGTVLEDVISPADVARTVAAAFVGLELFDGVVRRQDADPFDVLERLAVLAGMALQRGAVSKAALRRRLRTAGRSGGRRGSLGNG